MRCSGFLLPCLLLAACAQAPTVVHQKQSASSSSSSSTGGTLEQTYTNAKRSYSIQYPTQWKVAENDGLSIPHYHAKGTAFIAPPPTDAASTLLNAKLHVAVTYECPPQPYDAVSLTIDGHIVKRSLWHMQSDGHLYQGTLWTILMKKEKYTNCMVLTSLMEACNPGHTCPPEKTHPFDRKTYDPLFDTMAETFRFQ